MGLEEARKADNKIHGPIDFNRNEAQNLIVYSMTSAERAAMPTPKVGVIVHETDTGEIYVYSKATDTNLYTPTLTNVANVAASTPYQCQYLRVGDVVTVSGMVAVDPTSAATQTELGISLPVASNFADAQNCAGVASNAPAAATNEVGRILADTANNRASLILRPASADNLSYAFTFTYRVI